MTTIHCLGGAIAVLLDTPRILIYPEVFHLLPMQGGPNFDTELAGERR